MSCNCNGSGCAGCCGTSVLSPCTVCAPNTAANETLSSVLDNFITSFFGELTKTEVNGVVTWVLPCDLNVGLQNNPRLTDEGLACYFLRLFEDGIVGLTGPRGFKGDAGTDGASGVCFLTSAFTQPTSLCPDITVTVDNPDLLAPEMYVWIPGSGNYRVVQIVGNSVTLTLVAAVTGPNPTTSIDTPVIPSGAQGVQGETGADGGIGLTGPQGNPGAAGSNGSDGVSVEVHLVSTFTVPAQGAESALAVVLDDSLGSFNNTPNDGQWVWVEGGGYFMVSSWINTTTFKLTNPAGYNTNATPGTVVAAGSHVLAMSPPSPSDVSQAAIKATVRACSAGMGNVALANGDTFDGIALDDGDRVLVLEQTDAEDNGIYIVNTSGAWSRATDCDSDSEMFPGILVPVGDLLCTRYANTIWTLTWDMTTAFQATISDALFFQTNAFIPAYASIGSSPDNGANDLLMPPHNTWQTCWDNDDPSRQFLVGLACNMNLQYLGFAPFSAIPKFEVLLAGDYLCSFTAEAYIMHTGSLDQVRLGIFYDGNLVATGGGQCGGKLLVNPNASITLAGHTVIRDAQSFKMIELKTRNDGGNRGYWLKNCNFTVHRIY